MFGKETNIKIKDFLRFISTLIQNAQTKNCDDTKLLFKGEIISILFRIILLNHIYSFALNVPQL